MAAESKLGNARVEAAQITSIQPISHSSPRLLKASRVPWQHRREGVCSVLD